MRGWISQYVSRLAAFGSAVAVVTLLTGTFRMVEDFFLRHPALGVLAVGIDMVLFMIQRLSDVEVEERERRIRERNNDQR